jgi:hypothetical protein
MGTLARVLGMNEKMHRKTYPNYIAPSVFKPTALFVQHGDGMVMCRASSSTSIRRERILTFGPIVLLR